MYRRRRCIGTLDQTEKDVDDFLLLANIIDVYNPADFFIHKSVLCLLIKQSLYLMETIVIGRQELETTEMTPYSCMADNVCTEGK